MGKNSKTAALPLTMIIVLSCLTLLNAMPVNAQTAKLSPVQIKSSGDAGTNIQVITPQNQTSANNPVEVLFCVNVALLPYSCPPYASIGYSLDDGEVFSVNDLVNQTVIQGLSGDEAAIWAKVTLPNISEGNHRLTIYAGNQFEGVPENPQLQRYEVWAFSTVQFSVTSETTAPTPAVPELAWLAIVPLLLSVLFIALILKHRKITHG